MSINNYGRNEMTLTLTQAIEELEIFIGDSNPIKQRHFDKALQIIRTLVKDKELLRGLLDDADNMLILGAVPHYNDSVLAREIKQALAATAPDKEWEV